MKDINLVIHAGAHKTASSSLQLWLKRNTEHLKQKNVDYLDPYELHDAVNFSDLHNATEKNAIEISTRFLKFFSDCVPAKTEGTILLSHESILSYSNMVPKQIANGLYGSLDSSARCISPLSELYNVSIIFFVRRQDTFLESVYLEHIKRGNMFCAFDHYCQAINYRNISWFDLIEKFSAAFSNCRIVIKPFELVKAESGRYLREFLESCCSPVDERLLEQPFPYVNEGISEKALELILQAPGTLTNQERRKFGLEMQRQYPTTKFGKAKLVSEELSGKIIDDFKDENTKLFKKWMPQYTEFHY